MEKCLFCKIVSGDIPADILYRDDKVVAFRDISPQAPFHALIIPVVHIARVSDVEMVDPQLLTSIFSAAQHLAREHELEEGFRIVVNCGEIANQTVFHVHFHMLGKRQMSWPPG